MLGFKMEDRTTIQIKKKTLKRLRVCKIFERETYDELLNRLIDKIIGKKVEE